MAHQPAQTESCLRPFFHFTTVPYRNNKSYKEAWCLGCLDARIDEILRADQLAVLTGDRDGVRTRAEADTLARTTIAGMPICSNLDTLTTHVKNCKVCVPEDRRAQVLAQRSIERQDNAVKRARPILGTITNLTPSAHVSLSGLSQPFLASSSFTPGPVPLQGVNFLASPQSSLLSASFLSGPQPPQSAFAGIPAFSSSTPLHRTDTVPELPIPPNATDTQREFAEDLCRVFVACNIAWNAAANPELRLFFAKWLPQLRVPDRRTLAGPILRVEKQKAVGRVKSKVQGKLAMLQCDGWKNVARMPVITFMMTVSQQSYLLQSHNMFGHPKTGAKLWELTQSNVTSARETYGVETIGICTDDGPDGKCMRRLARESFPSWIVTVCWAHQNQLMIGDLLRQCGRFKRLISCAQTVIKWFMAHGTALSFLHDQQLSVPGTKRALMLLLPVVSRWGAQYVCISRLLLLESSMRSICYLRKTDLLALRSQSDDDEHDSRAQEVLKIVFDDEFWTSLAKVKEHLEPLAISSLIFQSPTLRLDQILLTLGNILYIITRPGVDPDAMAALLATLKKRWKATDQELFILAVLFNPYIRLAAFSDAHLSRAEVRQMCMRIYRRLFCQEATMEFWSACNRYFDYEGRFSDGLLSLDFHRDYAARRNEEIDLVRIWQDAQAKDTPDPSAIADQQLVSMAIRILSVIGNSIACERNFSSFGITHTKLRNSLAVESTHDINFVRMDINARHADAGLKSNRLKRHHGSEVSSNTSSASASGSEPASAHITDSEDPLHAVSEDQLRAASELIACGDGADPLDLDILLESSLPPEEPDPNEFNSSEYRKICITRIFKYPEPGQEFSEDSPLRVFWKGAIKLLGDQEELHEIAQMMR